MTTGITVAIPTITERPEMLARAIRSVSFQKRPPDAVSISFDLEQKGAPGNRDDALAAVRTPYVAFLDDDDEFGPYHLAKLAECMKENDADLVYPWFTVVGGTDPFPQWENQPWDDDHPHQVPVTWLAKTDLVRAVGGFSYAWDPSQSEDPGLDEWGNRAGEDYRLILRMIKLHAKIVHLPDRTWKWHHHARNTSGLASRTIQRIW